VTVETASGLLSGNNNRSVTTAPTNIQECQRVGVANRFVFYCFNSEIINNNNNQASELLNDTVTGILTSRYVTVSVHNKLTNKNISIPEIRIFENHGKDFDLNQPPDHNYSLILHKIYFRFNVWCTTRST